MTAPENFARERQDVLGAVQRIVALGLVAGASGNVSRRIRHEGGDLVAITASRVPYHRMSLDDIVVVDFEIEPVFGDGIPSSESLAHVAVYAARPDVGGVIHTHSVHASAFAVAGVAIPPILDEQVVTLGGGVEVAEYAASASEDLAENAVAALGERGAVLLRHHGVLGTGADLDEAVVIVELVERVAQIRSLTLLLGEPQELPEAVVQVEQKVYRMMKGWK
jgi:L-fuculose-phosphate aldolase